MTTFFCYIRSVLLFFNKNMDIKTNKEQKGKKKRYKGLIRTLAILSLLFAIICYWSTRAYCYGNHSHSFIALYIITGFLSAICGIIFLCLLEVRFATKISTQKDKDIDAGDGVKLTNCKFATFQQKVINKKSILYFPLFIPN